MDATQTELLTTVDLAELGRRLGAARRAKGLTQGELAGDQVSVGYVSRIEAGQRRPTSAVLAHFAARLGVTATELLLGISAGEYDQIRLALDYAELALESGEAAEAESRAAEVEERAAAASLTDLRDRARFMGARAAETQGRLDDAVLALEPLVEETEGLLRVTATVALSRCYRESGDFARSIDVGERTLRDLAGTPLESADEAVQLVVTVAAAHFERGDTGQAVRVCRRAVDRAEHLDSPRARAAAYWNASIMEAESGSVGNAVDLAERALTLLREGESERNLARLELELGFLQLELDPPDVDGARRNLEHAAEMFEWSSASPADRARNDLALARAHLLGGDPRAARSLAEKVRTDSGENLPLISAHASSLEGHASVALGDTEAGKRSYQLAVGLLTGLGADKGAAQLWYELADILEQLGDLEGARKAFRSAAASAGLRSTTLARVSAAVHG